MASDPDPSSVLRFLGAPNPRAQLGSDDDRVLTPEELANHNGLGDNTIYIAVKGLNFLSLPPTQAT